MTNRAFTLIEVLVAVMLTGLLTTMALVPVVRTVREVTSVQASRGGRAALSKTLDFIGRDLGGVVRLSPNCLTIRDHEALGGLADDSLLIFTSTPSMRMRPACTVVYKVVEGSIMNMSVIPGLYRWEVSGLVPNMVNTDTLEVEDAMLVLPYVRSFSAEVPSTGGSTLEDETAKSYSGQLPRGVIVKIERGERTQTAAEEGEELERIYVFP